MLENSQRLPWKLYIIITLQTLVAFYLATFSIAMFFIRGGHEWLISSIAIIILYLFVIFACAKIILNKLSIAAIMLIIPIAPLLALVIVVTLIPVLEHLI